MIKFLFGKLFQGQPMFQLCKLVILVSTSVLASFTFGQALDTERAMAKAQGIVGQFQTALSGELQAAMRAGGPIQAVEVCSTEADIIAQSLSKQHGVEVKRVSNKPRNPKNSPTAVDKAVLEWFENKIAADTNAADISKPYSEIKEYANERLIYHQAIFIQPICLTCHGESVSPELKSKISQIYPNDLATGYKLNELRGAFVVEFLD